jgi:hypothetical protein
MSCGGKLLIKLVVEQHDLAGNFVPRERGQLIKVVDDDYLCGDSLRRRSHAAAQRRKHYFLRCSRSHAGKFHQRSGFFSAHPVRDNNFFQLYVEPQLPHLSGHILRRVVSLRRSRRTRPDVVCQVSKLVPGIVAFEGRFLQLLEFSGKLRRVRLRLLKIALRKNETAKNKNKNDGKECFQSVPPERTALESKDFQESAAII